MASFKMMSSSTSRNSDLSRRNSSSASSSPSVRSNHLRRDPHADHHSRISFGFVGGNDATTVHDYCAFASDSTMDVDRRSNGDRNSVNNGGRKSAEDVWKEIVSGEKKTVMKEEAQDEYMMTLEDFLAKAAEMDDDEIDVKIPPESLSGEGYGFDYPMIPHEPQHDQVEMVEGSTRRKRGRVMVEAVMDKATAQRQKRMIKNRESAARSRERKQAYQTELETLAAKLERENEELLKEIEEKTRERYKNLMEKLIPVDDDEKRKLSSSSSLRLLSRSYSLEW
ncbi:G-box-binding factor 4 [Hirschfeldia incana]|nr:G-box-binding factor 4 [Hirschfeldia incana]